MDLDTRFDHILHLVKGFQILVPDVLQEDLALIVPFLLQVPAPFFTAPASSSGKFHPKFALGEGGLVRHTLAVMERASHFAAFLGLNESERKAAIIAAMLHDTYKGGIGETWENTLPQHASIAVDALDSMNVQHPRLDDILDAIGQHMGRWSQPTFYCPDDMLPISLCMALADYAASFSGYELV